MVSFARLSILFGFLYKMNLCDIEFCTKDFDCSGKSNLEMATFLADFLYEFELNLAVVLVSEDSLSKDQLFLFLIQLLIGQL